jgi:hypothetical protein
MGPSISSWVSRQQDKYSNFYSEQLQDMNLVWGQVLMQKTSSKKSRASVPLMPCLSLLYIMLKKLVRKSMSYSVVRGLRNIQGNSLQAIKMLQRGSIHTN